MAKMKVRSFPASHVGIVRQAPDRKYRVLVCTNPDCNPPHGCGDQWEIAQHDDGNWSIECKNCGETAMMLADAMRSATGVPG